MGAYLSTPSIEKKSDDFRESEKFSYGVSRMQGWRISMEDAHNCVPSLEDDMSLFGVYDGHGGSEVAMYCALHFADVLKNLPSYKEKKLEEALKEAFMAIDKVLLEPDTIKELKVLADREPDSGPPTEMEMMAAEKKEEEEEECEEEEMKLLHEEATMSIEDLLARYGKAANETKSKLEIQKSRDKSESAHSSSGNSEDNTANDLKISPSKNEDASDEVSSSSLTESSASKLTEDKTGVGEAIKTGESTPTTNASISQKPADSSVATVQKDNTGVDQSKTDKELSCERKESGTSDRDEAGRGDAGLSSNKSGEKISGGKIKSTSGKIQVKGKPVKLGLGDDEDFDPDSDSESDSEDGFASDEAVEGSSDSEEEEDDEEDPDDIDISGIPSLGPITSEEPGKDSGTTAVVALLNGNELFVANAGDSRCVLCRDGTAVDMSEDHKPEDDSEIKRIKAAGGHVNMQGRVNGGLNLSRAIGDHCYKTNSELDLENQMISAMPDVKKVSLQPGDNFMVLACDGIWNVFSSQEVVDFILARLPLQGSGGDFKLSSICEEMLDVCLAPDTMGDGTGCDNMTCIIVKFSERWLEKCKTDNPDNEEERKNCSIVENKVDTKVNGKNGGLIDDLKTTSVKRPRTDDVDIAMTVERDAKVQKVL